MLQNFQNMEFTPGFSFFNALLYACEVKRLWGIKCYDGMKIKQSAENNFGTDSVFSYSHLAENWWNITLNHYAFDVMRPVDTVKYLYLAVTEFLRDFGG